MSEVSAFHALLDRILGGMRWFWVLLGLLNVSGLLAGTLPLPEDGWASWRVAAVADAPDWCCPQSADQPRPLQSCDLDSRHQGFSASHQDRGVAQMQIYAHFKAGELDRIRAYGSSCPVKAKSAIADLGEIDAAVSAAWLDTQIAPQRPLSGEVMAALAVHAGEEVDARLNRIASFNPARESRKDALFWLGQVRGEPGARLIEPFLSRDPDAGIREHAAFAISQSRSPRRGDLLISQAQQDGSAQVRSQAWFWLAQTGDPRSESAITAALNSESSKQVRQQAVFALSQLPEPRAVEALIGVLENPDIALEVRKQALFWMGQSGDEAAIRYLDRMLATVK
ncbi:MAG: HEAT repeat domain-containing protein [Lysobacterales bacterium]